MAENRICIAVLWEGVEGQRANERIMSGGKAWPLLTVQTLRLLQKMQEVEMKGDRVVQPFLYPKNMVAACLFGNTRVSAPCESAGTWEMSLS